MWDSQRRRIAQDAGQTDRGGAKYLLDFNANFDGHFCIKVK
jgi:hypothetical protein